MSAVDQPVSVRSGEENNLVSLNDYLKKSDSPTGNVLGQSQFPGGYSNLTYLLRTENGEYILRRPPFGAAIKSAHDMGREFKVLSLLKDHYQKIPKPILYCEDTSVIGAPFYIMERMKGVILRPAAIKNIQVDPATMRTLSESIVDNLVNLHAIDIQKSGLIDLGKPEGYIRRQVEGWTKRYDASKTDNITEMDSTGEWIIKNQPGESKPAFLHNDYKYDNLVLNESNLTEIIGVLDWEMSTVGDPFMDLGASLAYWAEKDDSDLAKVFNISWLPGNLTRKEVVNRYAEKSGRTMDSPLFYYVFGLYKNAVIAQQIYARWKQGHSKDPRFGQLIHVIKNLGSRAVASIECDSI